MKKYFLVITLILCSKILFAQEMQLIVQIPVQNESNISGLYKQLNDCQGIHFSGYVKQASCLLIRYDRNIICDAETVIDIIKNYNTKLNCKVIEGYTAFDIIDGKLNKSLLLSSEK